MSPLKDVSLKITKNITKRTRQNVLIIVMNFKHDFYQINYFCDLNSSDRNGIIGRIDNNRC